MEEHREAFKGKVHGSGLEVVTSAHISLAGHNNVASREVRKCSPIVCSGRKGNVLLKMSKPLPHYYIVRIK